MEADTLKVRRIDIIGLLSKYDHSINFSQQNPFVIIHGPNGVGKTKFLEIVDALSNLRWRTLQKYPFELARIVYSNESILKVERSLRNNKLGERPSIFL